MFKAFKFENTIINSLQDGLNILLELNSFTISLKRQQTSQKTHLTKISVWFNRIYLVVSLNLTRVGLIEKRQTE